MASSLETALGRALFALPPALAERLVKQPATDGSRVLDPRLQLVLAAQARTHKPFEVLGVAGARKAYTALVDLVERPVSALPVRDARLERDGIITPIRVHHPANFERALPTLLYFHGGGFVIGGLGTHDHLCRRLARVSGAAVVAVDYRLAPEHPFPAAADDCRHALDALRERGEEFALDAERFAVGGDSAGGNLAAVTSPGAGLRFQLLYYPGTEVGSKTASKARFAKGFGLDLSSVQWFESTYRNGAPPRDPRISPVYGDLASSPPTRLVVAGFDVLRDEGAAYAAALRQAGVATDFIERPGWIHGFVHMTRLSGVTAALNEDALAMAAALFGGTPT